MVKLIIFIIVLLLAIIAVEYYNYRKSDYKKFSGKGFVKTRLYKREFEEYKIYCLLRKVKGFNRMLFHMHIPTENHEVQVVDAIFLNETGIYVVSTNNAVGRIFGTEEDKEWRLSLRNGRNQPFSNPIMNNKHYIHAINSIINLEDSNIFKSYIIFSDGCDLKDLSLISQNTRIIKKAELFESLKRDIDASEVVLSHKELYYLYLKLYPYTIADNKVNNT